LFILISSERDPAPGGTLRSKDYYNVYIMPKSIEQKAKIDYVKSIQSSILYHIGK